MTCTCFRDAIAFGAGEPLPADRWVTPQDDGRGAPAGHRYGVAYTGRPWGWDRHLRGYEHALISSHETYREAAAAWLEIAPAHGDPAGRAHMIVPLDGHGYWDGRRYLALPELAA